MKKGWLLLIILFFFSFAAYAEFTPANQKSLSRKVSNIIKKKNFKVGYVFIDTNTGLGVQVNGTREFPAASVAKVAVMAAAYNLSYTGKLDLNQKVEYKECDRLGGSGVLQWMRCGTSYTLWNLIRLMIVLSDNSATKMVVDTIGMPQINGYLTSEALTKITITDPTMLVEPPSSEVNLTSPYDMAKLLSKIRNSQGFAPEDSKEMLKFMRNQKYRWGIWRGVPKGVVVADKTGNLEGILNDAGIVFTKKGEYVLSIFTWGAKKQREARLLINELSKITYEEYTGEKVIKKIKAKKKIKRIKRYKKVIRRR